MGTDKLANTIKNEASKSSLSKISIKDRKINNEGKSCDDSMVDAWSEMSGLKKVPIKTKKNGKITCSHIWVIPNLNKRAMAL